MAAMNSTQQTIRNQIQQERQLQKNLPVESLLDWIHKGQLVRARGNLIFHTDPDILDTKLQKLLVLLKENPNRLSSCCQHHLLRFLVDLAVDLKSFLPHWVLCPPLTEGDLHQLFLATTAVLKEVLLQCPAASTDLVNRMQRNTTARLQAEGIEDLSRATQTAEQLLGNSLLDYIQNLTGEFQNSNLLKSSLARKDGLCPTELGNDYAVFLPYVLWLGGSFVTTNPVLIPLAWEIEPDHWNPNVDELIRSHYSPTELQEIKNHPQKLDAVITTINSLITMAVVEDNCRLLRDIFLITEGKEGYVSLQVSPKNHDQTDRMVSEVKALYEHLKQRLGGIPNVVFKLPATAAGLAAAEQITAQGIGVTITVQFGLFQAAEFAQVLQRGNVLVSYLALMNGRMAFPVRDEMKQRQIPEGVEAARWAGVEVARKTYRRLYETPEQGGLGIDPDKVKILIASLRTYDDWLPDISELWGCPVITVFPNVRRTYDSHARDVDWQAVQQVTPAQEIKTLMQSEIFRQAWWLPGESEANQPQRTLSLHSKDADAVLQWPPVAETLGQFISLYDKMGDMVKSRINALCT